MALQASVRSLRKELRGDAILSGDDAYDTARTVFNSMVDKRPAVIVQCEDAGDVAAAIAFAQEEGLDVAVRGGGHNVTGKCLCDDGLVIDLSRMRSLRVDPKRRTARVGGGATWGDVDHATQAFGLATTGGIVPSTGVGGLTLGGGIGYLNRKHGLACDNLLSADVVTADGRLLTASPDEHEDLFWALRGGGGNFGVVTSMEFRLHPVGPVFGGLLVYPLDRAREMLRAYRDWSLDAPDALRADATLLSGPEGPGLGIIVCYCGDTEEGRHVVQPLLDAGTPVQGELSEVPYAHVQNLLTDILVPGMRHYWKSGFLDNFGDSTIDDLVDFFADDPPPPFAAIAIEHLGGAIGRVSSDATAFPHRSASHSLLVLRAWNDAAEDEENIAWGRRCYDVAEDALESVYVNYLGDEGEARTRAAYGANYERLQTIKARYDPENVFRLNQNIEPAEAG